jgi:uncharacterized protein YkwD
LRSIQNLRAGAHPRISALTGWPGKHRAITHVSLVAAVLLAALALSLQGAAAGPTPVKPKPVSILPQSLGAGIPTTRAVTIQFADAMDEQSVMDSLSFRPASSWQPAWSNDGRSLRLMPASRWLTDARYVIRIAGSAAVESGEPLATPLTYSFTTETAPLVSDFQLFYAEESSADRVRMPATEKTVAAALSTASPPADTATEVSAATRITVGFSVPMDQDDVAARFAIRPNVPGSLSWEGNSLVFVPAGRLSPGERYAVSVIGARDARGNRLAGDASFSFTTRAGGQVVKVSPKAGSTVARDSSVQVWFSQPMDAAISGGAFRLLDVTSGTGVPGALSWNEAMTQLTFKPGAKLPYGHAFKIALGSARDLDRNAVTGGWSFATEKAPPPPPPPPPAPTTTRSSTATPARPAGPPAPADVLQFALWQINQSRAQYGFAPLALDSTITAEATAYAWDMMNYGYFSHVGRDGSHVSDRLRRAGVSFGWSGENICYYNGMGVKATLQWCHGVFMSEPYPGVANHIGNILSPNYTRVGIGIAQSGTKIKIVWDFAG